MAGEQRALRAWSNKRFETEESAGLRDSVKN